MKLSLIINTYNRPKLLETSLLSLSVQSKLPDEIIIADDGSKEDLLSVARKYKEILDMPIRYVTQEDNGFRLAKCRNNGAKAASGDFIFYIDQDLIFTNGFIETIYKNIKKDYFIVGWPIRTSENQLELIDNKIIRDCSFNDILEQSQIDKVVKQFKKDRLYRVLHNLKLRKRGTKFRGGVAGFFKDDFIKINGYDEKYIGWGNEDDDFGRRLFFSGVKGINPFKRDYPIHLWHKEYHDDGERVNIDYHKNIGKQLNSENFRCEYGYDNSFGDDKVEVIEL